MSNHENEKTPNLTLDPESPLNDEADAELKELLSDKPSQAPVSAPDEAPQAETKYEPAKKEKEEASYKKYPDEPDKHSRFAPMSTKNFAWSLIIMQIPVVGWLLTLIWAGGLCKNRNRRNLARAMLVLFLIGIVIAAVIYALVKFYFIPNINDYLSPEYIEYLKTIFPNLIK